MIRHLAIAAAITALVLLGLELGPARSALSPGVLATGHAKLACDECHTPVKGFRNNAKCVRCHADAQPGPVGQFAWFPCARCHTEHQGGATARPEMHDQVCRSCHPPALVPVIPPEDEPEAKWPRFHSHHPSQAFVTAATKIVPTSKPERDAANAACMRCHPMDPAEHAAKVKKPRADDCVGCHAIHEVPYKKELHPDKGGW